MTATALDPRARIGAVRLAVSDLDSVSSFYKQVVGLDELERSGELLGLGAGSDVLVELEWAPGAPPRPPGSTGLFHLALLVPDRADLARSLARISAAGWGLSGASDHLVSEALYLRDPEGNGIEIYRDRDRDEWRWVNGEVEMATIALDLDGLLHDGTSDGTDRMPAGTTIGHVHLNVADLERTEAFYSGALGFDVTVRSYPGALFLAAGGYHHHIGANTWQGEGAPPPPEGALGLRRFEVALPDERAVDEVAGLLGSSQVVADEEEEGLGVTDPSGNRLLLRA